MPDLEDSSPLVNPSRGCCKIERTIIHGVIVTILFFVIMFSYLYLYRTVHISDTGKPYGDKSYAIASLVIQLVAYAAVGCLYICNSSGRQEKIISAGFLVFVIFVFLISSIEIPRHSLLVDFVSGANIVAISSYCVWKLSFILQYCTLRKRVRIMLHGAIVTFLLLAIVLVYCLYKDDSYSDDEDVAIWLLGELVAYNAVCCLYMCNSSGRKEKIISAGFLVLVLLVFLLSSFVKNDLRVDFVFGANMVAISSYCVWKLSPDALLAAWLRRWLPAAGVAPREPARQEEAHATTTNRIQDLPREFSSDEIRAMTRDFRTMVGQGGFAHVFIGDLDDGTAVAVKQIKITSEHPVAGEADFLREVSIVGNVHHRSLVPLLGYCLPREGGRCLVYPFFKNGSLDRWLFHGGEEKRRLLTWPKRYGIALDVARALAYLHDQCRRRILHLDVNPGNILLDNDFRALVSDFGISLSITQDRARTVHVHGRGTIGYMAPEMLSDEVSDKADVFSYGMTLLELVGGRRNNDPSWATPDLSRRFFPNIAEKKMARGELMEAVDAAMAPVDQEAVEAVVKVALCCIQYRRDMRPSMQTVVDMLLAADPSPPPENRPSYAVHFSKPLSSPLTHGR